jgi:hypothetical protein
MHPVLCVNSPETWPEPQLISIWDPSMTDWDIQGIVHTVLVKPPRWQMSVNFICIKIRLGIDHQANHMQKELRFLEISIEDWGHIE